MLKLHDDYGGHSSVGRAPVCGTGCRGFEPHWLPQISRIYIKV
jgi:hypothetical protein